MTKYRVEIDGQEVWQEEIDGPVSVGNFPTEYFKRPAHTPDDQAHPPAAHLFLDDTLIGVQRSHGDEADLLDAAVVDLTASGDWRAAALMRLDAFAARALGAAELGDVVAEAQFRAGRANAIVAAIEADPGFADYLKQNRS